MAFGETIVCISWHTFLLVNNVNQNQQLFGLYYTAINSELQHNYWKNHQRRMTHIESTMHRCFNTAAVAWDLLKSEREFKSFLSEAVMWPPETDWTIFPSHIVWHAVNGCLINMSLFTYPPADTLMNAVLNILLHVTMFMCRVLSIASALTYKWVPGRWETFVVFSARLRDRRPICAASSLPW